MKPKVRWTPVLSWATGASVCTFLLWIPIGAVAGSLGSQIGIAATAPSMFLYVLYSPILAPVIVGAMVPVYFLCFWFWALSCNRIPWLDRGWKPLLLSATAISLPLGAALAAICARGPLGVMPDDFIVWLPFCAAIFWGAIVGPRWLFDSLNPGRFIEALREAPEHDV